MSDFKLHIKLLTHEFRANEVAYNLKSNLLLLNYKKIYENEGFLKNSIVQII